MRWGLLAGLGQGINQAANTLNAGLAEDRATKREAERAAIETDRWERTFAFKREQAEEQRLNRQEDIARADRIRSEDIAYRDKRDEIAAAWRVEDRSLKQIEGEMERLYNESMQARTAIARQFGDQIDSFQKELSTLYRAAKGATGGLGLGGEEAQLSPSEIQGRIEYLQTEIGRLSDERKEKLQEHRTEFMQLATGIAGNYDPDLIGKSSFKGYIGHMRDSLDRLDRLNQEQLETLRKQAEVQTTAGAATPEPEPEPGAGAGSPTNTPRGFGFGSGFDAARRALLERSEGSFYDGLVANNSVFDPEHTNMFGHILHPIGGFAGSVAGLVQGGVGGLMDLPGLLMETPAQAKERQAAYQRRQPPQQPDIFTQDAERRRQEMLRFDQEQRARAAAGYIR